MEEIIRNIVYIFITGVGLILVKEVMDFINKKIDEVQANTDIANYEKLNSYVDTAQSIIENIVLSVSQVYVESLKKSQKFDEEAQKIAKNKAIELAKTMISEESKNAIIILYGDFDKYIDTIIESCVKENK